MSRGGHAESLAGGGHGRAKRCRGGLPLAGQTKVARMAQEADVPGAGMPVDPIVTGVWRRVASPEVAASCVQERFASARSPPR